MNIQEWLLSTSAVIIIGLIGFFGKTIVNVLREIRQEMQLLLIANTTHAAKIEKLESASKDHENRLRSIEGVPTDTNL